MYKVFTVEDRVWIPPKFIDPDVKEAIRKSLFETLVGSIKRDLGVVLDILDVIEVGEGYIEPENPGIFYDAKYKVLSFFPELHEIVLGETITVTEFGIFARLGPIDGLCHISQIMDDYVGFDEKNERIISKDGKKSIEKGDLILARITAVSLERKEINKINLTMRQQGLGAIKWLIEEEKKKLKAKKGG